MFAGSVHILVNSTHDRVQVSRSGPVATITIDGKGDLNIIDGKTATGFAEAVANVEKGDSRVAVIRAAGENYCAGGDLSAEPAEFLEAIDTTIDALLSIRHSGRPYIVAMEGIAIGGGLEIALGCDIRLAEQGTTFALPEAERGIIPPSGAIRFLAQMVGSSRARDILLTGREFSAAEAEQWGLLREVTNGDLDERAQSLAEHLSQQSPSSLKAITQSLNEAYPAPVTEAKWDLELARRLAQEDDFEEGRRAFLEKRQPDFS